MPLTRFVADALGVVTICLVALLVIVGLSCIIYTLYFRNRICVENLVHFNYFNGPWLIRIVYVFFSVWWGIGEVTRLRLLRHNGKISDAIDSKWQDSLCKCYIVSSLGFAEPGLFLTLVFLLRASLQSLGTLSQKWNKKTSGFVLLYCLPMFVLQLVVILLGPEYKDQHMPKLPSYFIKAVSSHTKNDNITLCTYPLLSTIFLGLFATVITSYLFWLGTRILHLIINKGLQKRVYALIFSISSFFPLRVVLLGLSVLSKPEKAVFDGIVFLAFLSFLCCVGVGICILVYLPIADSLSLRNLQSDIEDQMEQNDSISLIATNQTQLEGNTVSNPGRNSSSSSPNRGSISFHTKEEAEGFVELSVFHQTQRSSPAGSPRLGGWPMITPAQVQEP